MKAQQEVLSCLRHMLRIQQLASGLLKGQQIELYVSSSIAECNWGRRLMRRILFENGCRNRRYKVRMFLLPGGSLTLRWEGI